MPTKIDVLIETLFELRETIGEFRASINNLEVRAAEDRELRTRLHEENQAAMGQFRDATQSAIAEMRLQADRRYTETKNSIDRLSGEMSAAGAAQAASGIVTAIPRARLAVLASIGFGVIVLAGWIVEAGVKWAVEAILTHWH